MRLVYMTCIAMLGAPATHANDTPPLANNPFLRPQLVSHAPPPAAEPVSPPLELRAILAAGDASRVDVGGRIVGVGEEIDGFRLVSVTEDGAVFERGGRSLRLALPPRAPAVTDAAQVAKESDDAE